jgi:hypothetical protein
MKLKLNLDVSETVFISVTGFNAFCFVECLHEDVTYGECCGFAVLLHT